MEHPAFQECLQCRGVCTRVYVWLVWIRNFKIKDRDQYGRRFFFYGKFFFPSYFLQKYINYCNRYIKKNLILFMFHHTTLLSNRLLVLDVVPLPRASFYVLLICSPLKTPLRCFPSDLHVLSMMLAFILS
jgi:hypothetical protein